MDEPYSENPKPAHSDFSEPELIDADAPRPRWQFSLWWLFVLMTAVAAIAALVRVAAVDFLSTLLVAYIGVITIYLVIRAPMLFSNSAEMRRIRANREKLNRWANHRRAANRAEEVSRDE